MSGALAQIENLMTAHYGDEVMRRTNGRYTYHSMGYSHTATNLDNTNQQTSGKRWVDSLLTWHYFCPLRYDAANMLLGFFFFLNCDKKAAITTNRQVIMSKLITPSS